MGFWFFGGRKNRKDSSKLDEHGLGGAAAHEKMAHRNNQSNAVGQAGSHRRNSDRPKRLTKIDRSIARDPDTTKQRSFTAPQASKNTRAPVANVPQKSETFPTPPANPFISPTEHFSNDVYQHNPASQSSIGQDVFSVGNRPPTLKAKRSSQDAGMPRRKTSKRRAEEREREREIRQMSSPIPIQKRSSLPAGLLRQDVKKIPSGFNRHLERPISEVSLPIPESLSSSVDEMAQHQHSFKVNAFDILAPRPTVRYTQNPRYQPSRSQTWSRSSDKRPTIPEEEYGSRRRIEELADSLDSTGLRELMERDRKRKEKKRIEDQEKLQRRLQRRAERQRQQEQKQANIAGPSSSPRPPASPSSQREIPKGLGIAPAAVENVEHEAKEPTMQRGQMQTPESWLHDPSKENIVPEDPFTDEQARVAEPLEKASSAPPERSFLRVDSPVDARMSQASIGTGSPPRSPLQKPRDRSSMSQMSGLQREYTPDIPEHREVSAAAPQRESNQSATQTGTWTSFFRRGGTRRKRASGDQARGRKSEFSNTSRESFPRQGPPPTMPQRTFRRSSTPIRIQSKFREDLPDFPLSPPDSRVQSPEAAVVPSNRDSEGVDTNVTRDPASQEGTGLQGGAHSTGSPKPTHSHTLSQSLASIDSEGSWLSGRPAKRSSMGLAHPLRQSETSLQQKGHGHGEEEDLANDEYLNRLSPPPDSRRDSGIAARRASSTILGQPGDTDDEAEAAPEVPRIPGTFLNEPGTTLHGGAGRRPTLVNQHGRVKSREGFVNESNRGSTDESEEDVDELITPGAFQEHEVKTHHVRRVSAGSAKLLDVRRSSIDSSKRLSAGEGPASQRTSISHEP